MTQDQAQAGAALLLAWRRRGGQDGRGGNAQAPPAGVRARRAGAGHQGHNLRQLAGPGKDAGPAA